MLSLTWRLFWKGAYTHICQLSRVVIPTASIIFVNSCIDFVNFLDNIFGMCIEYVYMFYNFIPKTVFIVACREILLQGVSGCACEKNVRRDKNTPKDVSYSLSFLKIIVFFIKFSLSSSFAATST